MSAIIIDILPASTIYRIECHRRDEITMSDSVLLGLAAQIVSAHVSKNEISADGLPGLITAVHRALATVGETKIARARAEPAVPLKKSVTPGHIACLECGRHFSMLKRHLNTDHQLTPDQYRQKWELPQSYPLVAPDYAKTRSTLAKKIGLGRKDASSKKFGKRAA